MIKLNLLSSILCWLVLSTHTLAKVEITKPTTNDYAAYGVSELSKEKVVIEWSSKEGQEFFSKAEYPNDFSQLAPFYQPQINPAYCGIATLTILKNYFEAKDPGIPNNTAMALDIHQPKNEIVKMAFPSYSQITFFDNKAVEKIKPKEFVLGANTKPPFDPGVNLDEFTAMAHALKLAGDAVHVDKALNDTEADYKQFIERLKASAADDKTVMVANFRGKIYGGLTGGHISPLVALSFDADRKDYRVLILDVAAHKNPWTWVPAKDIYHAMNSIDTLPTGEKKFRGYVVLSKKI